MPVRPIVRLGHPALRSPAGPLAPERILEPAAQELIDDMIETMRAASGVGLAAPQLGVELQVFVYEALAQSAATEQTQRGRPPIPLHVVINPMIATHAGEPVYDWEGCLSIPDLRGLVPRLQEVRVRGLDRDGQQLDYTASGFEARIVQHEFDHLNGVIFLDRMRDLKTLACSAEWERFLASEGSRAEQAAVG